MLANDLVRARARLALQDPLAAAVRAPERVAQATQTARQINAPGIGDSDRAAYLAAIDGMNFGEDPADGIVRGRRFLQPRLRFAFTAPESFVLDNTPRALLGRAPGGVEAVRLDSVPDNSGGALDAYLSSGWLDGLLKSSVQAGEINGMPAAFGLARADEDVEVLAFAALAGAANRCGIRVIEPYSNTHMRVDRA